MRVVVFSTDRKILDPDSASAKRQAAYAAHFDTYTVIIPRLPYLFSHVVHFERGAYKKSFLNLAWFFVQMADVISAQDPFETGLFAWMDSRTPVFLRGKPFHVQIHTDIFSPNFVRGSFKNHVRRIIALFVLHRARRIRVVSERVADELRTRGITAPVTVLPIFVDTVRFQNVQRIKHPRFKVAFLIVARLEKEKNVALAIYALKHVRDAGHDAGLTIVGGGSEGQSLKALVRSLGLERHVVFAGAGDPASHYASADAVLVPSLYEGYSMVTIEALAAGIPVIATDVGIAREAGAIVAREGEFPQTVVHWIESGPRQAILVNYPYASFDEYVQKYCDDIKSTAQVAV